MVILFDAACLAHNKDNASAGKSEFNNPSQAIIVMFLHVFLVGYTF